MCDHMLSKSFAPANDEAGAINRDAMQNSGAQFLIERDLAPQVLPLESADMDADRKSVPQLSACNAGSIPVKLRTY
jgi:hypothetical protein